MACLLAFDQFQWASGERSLWVWAQLANGWRLGLLLEWGDKLWLALALLQTFFTG